MITGIFILSFLAAFAVSVSVMTVPIASRLRVKQSLGNLGAYEVSSAADESEMRSFADRVIWPAIDRLDGIARRWTDPKRVARTQAKLSMAGIRHLGAQQFGSIKLGSAAVGIISYLLVLLPWSFMSGWPIWLGLCVPMFAYFLPDLWLERRVARRQRQIGAGLADTIDIVTIAVEAGLSFDSALAKVVKNTGGPLSEELGRVLGELQIGISRSQALKNLADRSNLRELQNFCATLIQAETLGVSIGKIMREEARELRVRRRQAAEEAALKTPVKLVFPVVLCILPALMIVILGPGIIRMGSSLMKML